MGQNLFLPKGVPFHAATGVHNVSGTRSVGVMSESGFTGFQEYQDVVIHTVNCHVSTSLATTCLNRDSGM